MSSRCDGANPPPPLPPPAQLSNEEEEDDDLDDLSGSITLNQPLSSSFGAAACGILSPSSLESADYYEELGGVAANSAGSSRQPTPLAFRAPWATPPKAPQESHKLSVTSPPLLPPFAPPQPAPTSSFVPPTRNVASPPAVALDSICVRVGDPSLKSHSSHIPPPPPVRRHHEVRSPESDFELHDLGESFPSTPTPVKWDSARYFY